MEDFSIDVSGHLADMLGYTDVDTDVDVDVDDE